MPVNIPTEIKRLDNTGIQVTWKAGNVQTITSEVLRRNCPCAQCREERGDGSHSAPLTGKKTSLVILKNSKEEQIKLERIWQVGQYALGMGWADGHQTGIYTFDYLASLT